jgi:ATP-dependent helicase/nuclease subunit B
MAHVTLFDSTLSAVFAELDVRQSLILTPNKRLSRFLLERYAALSQAKVVETPRVLSWQAWLLDQWREAMLDGRVLACPMSAVQEQLLWQKVLNEHEDTPALLNISATAKSAQDAWRLMHEWQLNQEQLQEQGKFQSDTGLFLSWAELFLSKCEEKSLVSVAEIPARLIEHGIQAPPLVGLYGFDELTPSLEKVLDYLQKKGVRRKTIECEYLSSELQRFEFSDAKQELSSVAAWARTEYERNPNQKIGIVIPELNRDRATVDAAFQREFEPSYILPEKTRHATGFNMSAGESMLGLPLCYAGLDVLALDAHSIDLELNTRLLNSPFIGCLDELSDRANLDLRLRDVGEESLRFGQIKRVAAEFLTQDERHLCPDYYQRLQNFERLCKAKAKRALPSAWIHYFTLLWDCMGWPGERSLDTLEYQQLRSFHEQLDQFAGLDASCGEMSYQDAIEALKLCLSQASFQAQTRSSPVQVLGLLEAAGLPFDQLWVTGLDDEYWPPAPKPNALLQIGMQVEAKLPQSSAERERLYARRLTERLSKSAAKVIFSSASAEGDKNLAPSALLKFIEQSEYLCQKVEGLDEKIYATQEIEAIADYFGPCVDDPKAIRGGAKILQAQAACPFQAFARHRLQSAEPARPGVGLNAAERGILIHRVLELVWKKLKDQNTLLEMDDAELDNLLYECIDTTLIVIAKKSLAGAKFLQLEKNRIFKLVRAWLELEKKREPFSVLFNEDQKTLALSKLPIHMRYDRVDELANGDLMVVDYKTGNVSIKSWEGERPDEPQVPLYAIANKERVGAVAFGQVNDKEIAIKGIAADAGAAPGLSAIETLSRIDLPQQWPLVLAHWQSVLEQLAQEFMEGAAQVSPKHTQTCRYCELHSLCRIRESFETSVETKDVKSQVVEG